jgi:hypothetical protein
MDRTFRVKDGTAIHNLQELYDHLAVINDFDFQHHIEHNDFANWVEHALDNKFLAAAMRRARTKEELRKTIFIALFR